MDRPFYPPRLIPGEWLVRPCTPHSFQTLKVHKPRGIRQAKRVPEEDDYGFETRSSPDSLAATRRDFTFYVADPIGSIRGSRR
jgi:hypothetical protein